MRWSGIAPAFAATLALLLGLTLVASGWPPAKVQFLRRVARQLQGKSDVLSRQRRIACLEAAAFTAPDFARVRIELARAHLDELERERAGLEENLELGEEALAAAEERITREQLLPALAHYVHARDLCPLLGEPHLQISAHVDDLERADPSDAYLDRATRLMPHDPEAWYIRGLQTLLDGYDDRAWKYWRRSLEISDLFLAEIVQGAVAVLGDQGLLGEVLPERPDLFVRAALLRYPNADQAHERQPYFERAHALLSQPGSEAEDAERFYIEAVVDRGLGDWRAALAAYESALQRKPNEVDWRYEFAELLFEQQRLDEAHRELVTILRRQPDHARAGELYGKVSRRRAEGR